MRLACDTGGTFTDLVVHNNAGEMRMYKASTVPSDPTRGVLDALALAADDHGLSLRDFLAAGDILIHGTTHAINAILTGNTARTALIVTRGHREILTLREGGRADPFDFATPYPRPYIPRALTFEAPERIDGAGRIVTALDEASVVEILSRLKGQAVEAVAVCLLWSIVNPQHELRIGALIEQHLPGVPYTLSHQLNPTMREYRRASAAAIDASLKPMMATYLGSFADRVRDAGFGGRVMILTSQGGMIDGPSLAAAPVHAINSGPSMAPVAGRHFTHLETTNDTAIVADTGGTTYDVSLVRGGRIPLTRDSWIGKPYSGHMTGLPSVDVKSVGAGGGSIAWVDAGGVLHIGPQSAGSAPGPACYGRGGTLATVTDACVVLGYIDPDYFLGGKMALDRAAAVDAVQNSVAGPCGMTLEEAAAAIVELATENMVGAIEEITVNQGIDPTRSVLIGGGGAAGLNSIFIARRLGCRELVIPEVGAALSAFGALISEVTRDFRATFFTTSATFDYSGANAVIDRLTAEGRAFLDGVGEEGREPRIELSIDARYRNQVWELEIPLPFERFEGAAQVAQMVEAFHTAHQSIFSIRDEASAVEIVAWTALARCRIGEGSTGLLCQAESALGSHGARTTWFGGKAVPAALWRFAAMPPGEALPGPAIIESPFTTVVVDPGSTVARTASGSLVIRH
jgi:N-methylhydantoinase A